jgi:hypothetical protein
MAQTFQALQAQMSLASWAYSEATAERLIREMALGELRAARALTQEHLSTLLGVQQSAISKLERRADMYVSTLRHFIEAMGGQRFPTATSALPNFRCSWRRRPSGTQGPPRDAGTGQSSS